MELVIDSLRVRNYESVGLWLGLITKSLKEGEDINEKLQMYPWPGRLAPGVIDIPADRILSRI